jgi:Glycosyltransferase family 87
VPIFPTLLPPRTPTRFDWLLRWPARERKTIYLCAVVLAGCSFFYIILLLQVWRKYQIRIPGQLPDFNDFFGLWSYAKIANAFPAVELYEPAILHVRQLALGLDPNNHIPYLYPPTFIIFLWPLNLLSFEAAYVVWITITLALFIWAVIAYCSRTPLCVLGVIVAPACILNIVAGQSGFLSAALLIAGLRLAASRPILSGIFIGILSYKPQLALLTPIALAGARHWTAFVVAGVTVLGLGAIAALLFGLQVWSAWASILPTYAHAELVAGARAQLLQFMPTISANLQLAGIPPSLATGTQAIAAIVVAILVAIIFRRRPGRLATAALLVGTFLATPHALLYDMPMIAAAIALFVEARLRTNSVFHLAELLILGLALLFPILMIWTDFKIPAGAVPLLLLFGLILYSGRQEVEDTHLARSRSENS